MLTIIKMLFIFGYMSFIFLAKGSGPIEVQHLEGPAPRDEPAEKQAGGAFGEELPPQIQQREERAIEE